MAESKARPRGRLERLLAQGSRRPLGARVEGAETTFRLFAPRASQVTVVFYKHLDAPEPTSLGLRRLDDGVWEAEHPADLHGWYYHYQLDSRSRGPTAHFNKDRHPDLAPLRYANPRAARPA